MIIPAPPPPPPPALPPVDALPVAPLALSVPPIIFEAWMYIPPAPAAPAPPKFAEDPPPPAPPAPFSFVGNPAPNHDTIIGFVTTIVTAAVPAWPVTSSCSPPAETSVLP